LFYKTSLLACNCFQIWGGDDSILWLSFAQQKSSFELLNSSKIRFALGQQRKLNTNPNRIDLNGNNLK
jgi:hypothetical protein